MRSLSTNPIAIRKRHYREQRRQVGHGMTA
jgi:hypothetical protein